MINRLLITNSHLVASKKNLINVFATETQLTFRLLQEINLPATTDNSLLSHTLNFPEGLYASRDSEERIVLNHEGKNYHLLFENTIYLENLKNFWKAGQIALICVPSIQAVSYKSPEISCISLYPQTYTTKASVKDFTNYLRSFTNMGAFLRFIPQNSQNFLTSPCQLLCDSQDSLVTNLSFSDITTKEDIEKINAFYNSHITQVTIKGSSSIHSNQSEILDVEVLVNGEFLQEPLTLKVECVDGYAPHTRVEIVNGKGQFKVTALGLNSGETMRIKLNDGYFTSKAEHIFEVI